MKKFSELGVSPVISHFVGDKIKIDRTLNKNLVIHDFKIVPSKFQETDCLHIQIELDSEKRVIFTSSKVLIATLKKVPREEFPFECQIVKNSNHYELR